MFIVIVPAVVGSGWDAGTNVWRRILLFGIWIGLARHDKWNLFADHSLRMLSVAWKFAPCLFASHPSLRVAIDRMSTVDKRDNDTPVLTYVHTPYVVRHVVNYKTTNQYYLIV